MNEAYCTHCKTYVEVERHGRADWRCVNCGHNCMLAKVLERQHKENLWKMTEDLIDVQHKAYEEGRKQGEQEARQQVLDKVLDEVIDEIKQLKGNLNNKQLKGNLNNSLVGRIKLKIEKLKHKEED